LIAAWQSWAVGGGGQPFDSSEGPAENLVVVVDLQHDRIQLDGAARIRQHVRQFGDARDELVDELAVGLQRNIQYPGAIAHDVGVFARPVDTATAFGQTSSWNTRARSRCW
jgi:hypothetical protein